ncbi:uncharacterized protein SGFS_018660 [Streptomyces graminofaciens]|uniref:Uncharacterized protein n=1 Tax=Streptomyces graminofaciens TaxID=68212 RepID=A0ABN5VCT6_9ACTN|nr:hypothetical protein [Streptomyces graminofaciens]BBC30572.1 uncharacterized protein SGFS_018660 [Streptomyces graminofaciens]
MPQPHEIKITVTSALAGHPYQRDYAPQVTAMSVLSDALTAFGFASDGTTRYYLFFDGHEVPPEATVGELAGHAKALHLKLRTETTNG